MEPKERMVYNILEKDFPAVYFMPLRTVEEREFYEERLRLSAQKIIFMLENGV
jgi:hypothetical protein